jgi:hypothetical protein
MLGRRPSSKKYVVMPGIGQNLKDKELKSAFESARIRVKPTIGREGGFEKRH